MITLVSRFNLLCGMFFRTSLNSSFTGSQYLITQLLGIINENCFLLGLEYKKGFRFPESPDFNGSENEI